MTRPDLRSDLYIRDLSGNEQRSKSGPAAPVLDESGRLL
jgi:hypothetical protein